MFKSLFITLVLLFFSPINLLAYEVDQFTNRDEIPADSTQVIDQEINRRIKQAIDKANAGYLGVLPFGRKHCNSDKPELRKDSRFKLFENLSDVLSTDHPIGVVEDFANGSAQVKKRTQLHLDQSIYGEAKDSFEVLKRFGITSVITVNGTQIGTDKLGHFLSQGYGIYLRNAKRQDEKDRNNMGILDSVDSEKSYYGLARTGVKSYADMAANYDGHRFWNKLCGFPKKDDPKPYDICEKNSFVVCQADGNWAINPEQKFTLKDYVTPAWDESINCSSFHPAISEMVFKALSQRVYTYKGNPKQPCPAEPQKCFEITERYRSIARQVINPICKKVAFNIRDKKLADPKVRYDYTYYYDEHDKKSYSPRPIKTEKVAK